MTPDFINTPEQLQAFCHRLQDAGWLAVDTEFVREKSYYAELCLIQVATGEQVACIDPLAIDDLSPLMALLYDPGITKVFHAARQDLEIFFDLNGRVPAPVFDTQIAATLVGLGEQIGYATLVAKLLNITLDKSHSRTDWRQRPLSEAQIRYAADDVIHLGAAYLRLREKLEKAGRLDWLEEDFAALCDRSNYVNEPDEMWRRVKGAGRLKGVQLNVLRHLAAWRETQARRANRPRRWILRDELLLDMARLRPDTPAALAKLRGMEARTVERHGEELLRLIARASREPRAVWPTLPQAKPLSERQAATIDALMAIIRLCAAEAGVSAGSLASRGDLEQLIRGDDRCALLHGWRYPLAGRAATEWLAGRRMLCSEQGELKLLEVTDSP
ncbi:MAG: ribonuclease D [Gammaproteobacteria bacterium]